MGAALILPNEVELDGKRQVVSSWKGMYFIRPSEKGRLALSLFEGPLIKKSINFFSVSFLILGIYEYEYEYGIDYAEAGK